MTRPLIVSVVGGYPYTPGRDSDPDRLRPLLHRQAGPRRAARRAARPRRRRGPHLPRPRADRHHPRPARPGPGLAAVRASDTFVVPKLDRLARSVPDARAIG